MLKVIATSTNKGGEGKTMMSIMLSEYAALVCNKRVLAVDLDPQANFSKYFLDIEYDHVSEEGRTPPIHPEYDPDVDLDWDGRSTIANIFYGEAIVPYPTYFENIDILPAHSAKLEAVEEITESETEQKVYVRLKEFVQLDEVRDMYDMIIIDTPPSKGHLTKSALKACTDMIIPTQMEEDSVDGIYGMLQLWQQEMKSRPPETPINLAGILANRVRNVSLHREFFSQLKSLESTRPYLIETIIKERIVYGELRVKQDRPKGVFELNKEHPARKECEDVCNQLMERIYKHA